MKNFKKVLLTGTLTATAMLAISITSKAATVKVTGDTLNIRKGPSTDTSVIAMISKGVECELLEEEEEWYKIKYKNYTGYISKQYAKMVEEKSENIKKEDVKKASDSVQNDNDKETKNNETDKNANLVDNEKNTEPIKEETTQIVYKKINKDAEIRLLPLIHSRTIENIKKNTQVLFITNTSGWSYIQTDTVSGWVRNDVLGEEKKVSSEPEPEKENTYTEKTGYVNENLVNMRTGAGTSYKVIKVLSLNSKVTVINEEGNWYKVKSGNDTGYISKEFISNTKKVTTRGTSNSRAEQKTTENNEAKVVNASNKTEKVADSKNDNATKQNANADKANSTSKETNSKVSNTAENTKKSETNNKNTIKGSDVVAYAKKYLGYKYVYGGDGSNGTFDCSGFTMYVYKHFGISIPHGATSQYKCGKGTKISKQSELKEGDIVLLTDYETGVGIGHCGIYVGNGNFIHASTTTYSVIISSLNTTYKGRFYAGLRLI